jgi:mannose-6-phosphate isomerase
MSLEPIRTLPSLHEKVWGSTALEPWFASCGKTIGEIWLTGDDNRTCAGGTVGELLGRSPLLVKFIFTSERLSVQVHPDDAHAAARGYANGKTEMWHVLRAEPGACVAIGLRESVTRERLREAALSGEIVDLLHWLPARAGDTFFVPAGAVHAIGPGLALCEVQQNSDVTYRLYDYGRPRELHLDDALAVAALEPFPQPAQAVEAPGCRLLAHCRYFHAELIDLSSTLRYRPDATRANILVFLEGGGALGGSRFAPGQAWIVPECAQPFDLKPDGAARLLRVYVP